MKHIENSFIGKNAGWRYLVMIVAIVLATNTIGAIPVIVGYVIKLFTNPEVIKNFASNPTNLSLLGYSEYLTLFMIVFPFLAGLGAFCYLVKPLHQRSFLKVITGSSSIRWNRFLVSSLVWILLSAAYLFIYKGIDPSLFRLNNTSVTLLYLALLSFLLIPFQATFEEVIFRGYLMQGFTCLAGRESRNPKMKFIVTFGGRMLFPLIMTSLLFSLMHTLNPEIKEYGFLKMMPQYLVFGLLFGIITILDDGIEVSTGVHAAHNIFLSIMVTNSSSVLQTPALFEQLEIQPWPEFWASLVTAAMFFFIMKILYRWNDMPVLWRKIVPGKNTDQAV